MARKEDALAVWAGSKVSELTVTLKLAKMDLYKGDGNTVASSEWVTIASSEPLTVNVDGKQVTVYPKLRVQFILSTAAPKGSAKPDKEKANLQ